MNEAAKEKMVENLVIVEALKARYNSGNESDLYFFRDQRDFEIDLVLNDRRRLFPFEIKAGQTYSSDYAANLNKFHERSERIQPGVIIYAGDQKRSGPPQVINFRDTAQAVMQAARE